MNKKTKRATRGSNKTKNRRRMRGSSKNQSSSLVETNSQYGGSGLFSVFGDKISSLAKNAAGYVAEKGLRLVGLQQMNKENELQNPAPLPETNSNQLNNAATSLVADAKNAIGTVSGFASDATSAIGDAAAKATSVIGDATSGLVSQAKEAIVNATPAVVTETNAAIKDTASEVSSDIKETAADVASDVKETANKLASDTKEIGNSVVNNVVEVADKGSAAVVGQINEVLTSPIVGETLDQATATTAAVVGEKLNNIATAAGDVVEESLDIFNKKINDPKLQAEVEQTMDTVSDLAEIGVNALDKPLNKAIDKLNDAGTKAASGIGVGAVKVATNMLSAAPGLGAVIALGRIVNNGAEALENVSGAFSDAASTAAEVVSAASDNISHDVKELGNKKKESATITNRTADSINKFENPSTTSGGGHRTMRNMAKRGGKTKRVRFSL
jgi:hypothetical protein